MDYQDEDFVKEIKLIQLIFYFFGNSIVEVEYEIESFFYYFDMSF